MRQLDAQRGQGEGLPASIVRHGDQVSCVAGREKGVGVVGLLYNDEQEKETEMVVYNRAAEAWSMAK